MTPEMRARASNPSCPIVGIGASAGGLEAFRQLLEHLPVETGLGFVLVQHLDPTHESILAELLSRVTSIPVSEVTDGTLVQPDHVYVIPPNTNMTIAGGVLKLLPRQAARGQHRPIDDFFRSLAEDRRHQAIGVILSGTASDGTQGLEAIKADGGITFAQEEQSAKYAGMPHSAIAAGCVDYILPPDRIAQELARIGRHPYLVPSPARQPAEPVHPGGTNVEHILLLLRQATGVDFAKYKANTIGRRIARRMLLQRTERLEQYVSSLQDNPAEVEALYQDLLIGVTGFFRNPDAFEALKKSIFRELTKHRSADEPLRVWVCGCSTGEEAYSIAMAFLEFAEALPTRVSIQVFATDINERAIGQARRGRYPKTVAHDLSPERLRRFFAETDGGYLIGKPVRDLCVFAKHNVLSDPPFSRIDLISCRNLLIYLEPVLQKQIVPLLHYALRPTGFLWLGASEGVGAFSNLFAPLDKKHRMYSKKPAPAQPTLDIAAGGPPTSLATVGKRTNIVGEGLRSSFDPQEEADRLILARYAPAAVVINAELEILQARGDTSQYLQLPPGKATLNVLHLARADFSGVLRMAIHQAMNQQVPVRKEGLPTASPGQSGALNLEVVPLTGTSPQQRYFLVLFLPTAPPAAQDSSVTTQAVGRAASSRRGAKDREIVRLRQELAATRDHLESVIEQHEAATEELQSAGEEIQSSNEELQSINEELETAKEELESSNEELTTINEELQGLNLELHQLNSDLVNLLSSVNIPIVIVGDDLRIRRFTSTAEHILNVIATDIGRPISDIKPNININLVPLIVEAVGSISVKEQEVQDQQGRWYQLQVRPYRTLDNKIDGAVVVLFDIDLLKQSQQRIEDAREAAEAAVRLRDEFLSIAAHELRTPLTTLSAHSQIALRRLQRDGDLDREELLQSLEAVRHQTDGLALLITRLMDVSRIESGRLPLELEQADLTALVESVAARARVRTSRHAISVKAPRSVRALFDPLRLEQVLTNLLDNAIKYGAEDGPIELVLSKPARGRVELAVRDHGAGIPPEKRGQIFERFYQADEGLHKGGMGLGLYVSRQIVELHGGRLLAEFPKDGGARFIVRLPTRIRRREAVGGTKALR